MSRINVNTYVKIRLLKAIIIQYRLIMWDAHMPVQFFHLKSISQSPHKIVIFLTAFCIYFVSAASAAQTNQIEVIKVTVQNRPESIQKVPVAITGLTGDFIQNLNLDNIKDLSKYTPGLTGNSQGSFTDVLQIRGIYTTDFGVGGDPSIGFFKNGHYQGRSGAMVTSLYDIDRAEIARGSQGFLIGRNSIAGAINIFTTQASLNTRDAYLHLDIAQGNRQNIEAASNFTIASSLAARIAIYSASEDGYVEDAFDTSRPDLLGHDKKAARLSFLWELDDTEINVVAELEDHQHSGMVYRAIPVGESWQDLQDLFDVSLAGDINDIDSDLSLGENDAGQILNFGLQIDHDLSWATLFSLTSYQDHDWSYAEDYDGTALTIASYSQEQQGEYFDQELRLVSKGNGKFTWFAGISAYKESIKALFVQQADEEIMCAYYLAEDGYANCNEYFEDFGEVFEPSPDGLLEKNRVIGKNSGYAAYFDLNYAFTNTIDASFGARYSNDSKDFSNNVLEVQSSLGPFYAIGYTTDGFLNDKKSWRDLAPRVLVRYRPNKKWMMFGSITSGYKSGGFGSFAINPEPEFGDIELSQSEYRPAAFDPEQVISYEIGSKHTLSGGRTRLDLNAYYYDYEDLQVVVDGPGGGIRVDNIGEVIGWGLEASLEMILSKNWDLFISSAWANSEMKNVQALCNDDDLCEGNGLPDLPEISFGIVLQGNYPVGPGEWISSIEAFGQSKTYGGFARNQAFQNGRWEEVALRAGYRSNSGWELTAYLENALDTLYFDGVIEDEGILPGTTYGPSKPRTLGLRLNITFD